VARAESSLASQRAEELEGRYNALRSRVDKTEALTRSEVKRTHAQFVDTYRELGAQTADFEVPGQEAGLRFLEWLQEELLVLPTIVTSFMSFASLVTCEGAMNVWGTDIPRVHWKGKRPHERPKGPINRKAIPSWAWGGTTSKAG
jgi:hypothetical protein